MPQTPKNTAISYFRQIGKVAEYVEKHYAERLNLNDAAKIAGMEPKYFSVCFKKKTGIGFITYLNSVRVAAAQQLLDKCDYSIAEIAFAVGFENITTFERRFRFKQVAKITPRQYQQNSRAYLNCCSLSAEGPGGGGE